MSDLPSTEQMIYWLDSIIQAEHTEIDTLRGTATKRKIPSHPMFLAIRLRLAELTDPTEEMKQAGAAQMWEEQKKGLVGLPGAERIYKAMVEALNG